MIYRLQIQISRWGHLVFWKMLEFVGFSLVVGILALSCFYEAVFLNEDGDVVGH